MVTSVLMRCQSFHRRTPRTEASKLPQACAQPVDRPANCSRKWRPIGVCPAGLAFCALLYGSPAVALPPPATNPPYREAITYLGCSGAVDERYLKLDASLVLHKDFVDPSANLDTVLR